LVDVPFRFNAASIRLPPSENNPSQPVTSWRLVHLAYS